MIRPRFTISILCMFDLARVMRCISSVMSNSRDYNLVLTDNGAEDGIPQYFDALARQYSFIKVVHNPRNLGFQFPNKLAFGQCATPYFITLNDDAEVPPGWLKCIEDTFRKNPRAALVGPMGSPCSLYEDFNAHVGHQVEYIEGSCCACKTDIVAKLGLFSDQLKGAYLEDQDLSLRVREAGFSIHLAPFQIVHHRSSTARQVPEVKEWIAHNIAYMHRRWSGYFQTRAFANEKPVRATVVYVHVPGKPEFAVHAKRFVDSYIKNPPGIDHDTLIVCNGDETPGELFTTLPNVTMVHHNNTGMDIGAYLLAAKLVGTDVQVSCGSHTTFRKPGWLLRMLEVWATHGPGVYGCTASYQIRPHLNTSGFWCAPEMLRRYQGQVVTKQDRYEFEHGPNAFWIQMATAGWPVKLITPDEELDWQEWRNPRNGFCKGDQSDCMLWYHILESYQLMPYGQKSSMSNLCDTLTDSVFLEQLNEVAIP